MSLTRFLRAARPHVAFLVGLGAAVGLVNLVWHYLPDDEVSATTEPHGAAAPTSLGRDPLSRAHAGVVDTRR